MPRRNASTHWLHALCRRGYSTNQSSSKIVHIPRSNVYRFGDANGARSVFRDLEWTVNDGENWAVVGSGSGEKTALLETLLGNLRISPPPPSGPFPFLSNLLSDSSKANRPFHEQVSLVSFAHRPRASGGTFYDYTARYGAVREEDRITLRQSMFPEESGLIHNSISSFIVDGEIVPGKEEKEERVRHFQEWVEGLGLEHLLDLPLVALSNGQTRRARIVKALLNKPGILLLDEPLTGLDVQMRPTLLSLLHQLHESRNPRVILGLRMQDPIPEWISHIAVVSGGRVQAGPKQDIEAIIESTKRQDGQTNTLGSNAKAASKGLPQVLVDMRNVNVKYHDRHVLKNINWVIKAGDRWHLQGANGSGKTTLLSMLTGDHPQSYTQQAPSLLSLFGSPRRTHATATLRTRIGVVSPELYNAWPRARNMSVWEAVATGFDGGFVPLGERGLGVGLRGGLSPEELAWREQRVWEVLGRLGPQTWGGDVEQDTSEEFSKRTFSELPAGAQSIVLLMRALVGQPEVVLLDEVWAGMDEGMIKAARRYLKEDGVGIDQGVVVISHWEEEVPWGKAEGVRRFRLDDGVGQEV
ncbi:ABC transporter [Heterobasidion irregulare TC 32-1]|uniref:ABC transporter n=1 Tax=Heterobasidion irregulare (strain TC 32-1) TaxID=747525 RepID=W4JP69_HETIT|nr:ABC transporter [Heterobasidion irregulare TC 32-1]ETW74686.1 ABC transporter [Heterobasidion irregulare TC 32-1]